jgi:hypothetical protein
MAYVSRNLTGVIIMTVKKSSPPARNEQTSTRVASIAGKALSNPNSSKVTKTLAATGLTQARDKKK